MTFNDVLLFKIHAFIFGAIWGSFANVLIYRLPREKSVVKPRSSCPQCGHMIRWFENIPIISFIFLRAKCSSCKHSIPVRYLTVEIFAGIMSAVFFPESISFLSVLNYLFFFSVFLIFLVHFFIDIEFQILPDSLNLLLAILFLLVSVLEKKWSFWLSGAAIGFIFPYSVTWIFYKIKGVEGLGGGDIKLYTALGIYLGPLGIIQNIFLSCLLGSILGLLLILLKKMNKQTPMAFGPFILVVAFLQIFLADRFNQFLKIIF